MEIAFLIAVLNFIYIKFDNLSDNHSIKHVNLGILSKELNINFGIKLIIQ